MTERYFGKTAVTAVFLFIFSVADSIAVASISVSPVRIDLGEAHTKDVIRVSNQEQRQKSYQVEVVAWSQEDGQPEVYAPTDAILAVPPLFTLEPGEEQLVRIGMMEAANAAKEQTYRVFITEIASPQSAETPSSGVAMRLQIGVPVFVAPQALPFSTFDLIESNNVDGKLFLKFRNGGNTHVKVSEVQYQPPGIGDAVVSPTATYVLAGQTGYLPVPSPDGRAVGKVTLVTDSLGTLEYELPGTH